MSEPARNDVENAGSRAARPPIERPRHQRLGSRLTRAALAAAGLALMVAGTVLNGSMYLLARDSLLAATTAQAHVLAGNVAAPLMFDDAKAAADTLSTLEGAPNVEQAALRNMAGKELANYRRRGLARSDTVVPTPPRTGEGQAIDSQQLVVWMPVTHDGRALGQIELVVTLAPLFRQAAAFVGITALAAVGALAMAYLLAVGVRRDINRTELRLDELAYVDSVTGLPNRRAATEQLRSSVVTARERGHDFTLMLLDLDDFKLVNDTLGHHVGDQVLRTLAERLQTHLPAGAHAYRLGGDEFVVLLPNGVNLDPQQLLAAVSMPMQLDSREIRVRCSAGLARFPHDALDEGELLRAADVAMYQAKSLGKDHCAIYRVEQQAASRHRLLLEGELRQALERHEFRLHYQPIVELETGAVVGAEALLRWQHPQRGLVGPLEFIGVCEESGLIVEIGGWVLDEAARQLRAWAAQGVGGFWLSVNVSARQLRRGVLLQQAAHALALAGSEGHRLEIEITEHSLMEDVDESTDTLAALRERGVRVAVDDFGTGQSSLAYLKRLPVDKFKIDRSFVRELPADRGDRAIVGAIAAMARALDLPVVAEGIETPAQRVALLRAGCQYGQGFLFGAAMPSSAFNGILAPCDAEV